MSQLIRRSFAVAAFAGTCAVTAAPALAQMPPDIAAKIAALGRVVDPNATATIYAPLQESEPYAGVKVLRDVKYGPSERNVLDVFAADGGRKSISSRARWISARAICSAYSTEPSRSKYGRRVSRVRPVAPGFMKVRSSCLAAPVALLKR